MMEKLNPYMWLIKIAGAALAALVLWKAWQGFTGHYIQIGKDSRNEEVASINRRLGEFENAYSMLALSALHQNDAVNALRDESERKRRNALEALKKSESKVGYSQRILDAVAAREMSRTGGKTCSEAVMDAKNDLAGVLQ